MEENMWLLDEEEEDDDFMLTVTLFTAVKRHKNIRMHRFWKHPIFRRRKQFGSYYHLIKEPYLDDAQFHSYFRMDKAQFDTKQGQGQHSGNTFLRHNLEFPIWISGILVRFGLRLRLRSRYFAH